MVQDKKILFIDLETFSDEDIKTAGIHKYFESFFFDIQLCAFVCTTYKEFLTTEFTEDDVQVYDLANGDTLPDWFIEDLYNPEVQKHAHNAAFERNAFSAYLNVRFSPESWHCSAHLCGIAGLPLSLDKAGKALNIKNRKKDTGKKLIKFFSMFQKDGSVNNPADFTDLWEQYKLYHKYDVLAEIELEQKLASLYVPDVESKLYEVDQDINDTGIYVDLELAEAAEQLDTELKSQIAKEAFEKYGLQNLSPQRITSLLAEYGLELESVREEYLEEVLKGDLSFEEREILTYRIHHSRTSNKKYQAIVSRICLDGRVRGFLQIRGASRTGRFAGRGIQIHNLKRNKVSPIKEYRERVKAKDLNWIQTRHGDALDVVSQCIRTTFIPSPGNVFPIADYAAIEARVTAWLAGEEWRLKAFAKGTDIYSASYSKAFNVPLEKCGKGTKERGCGKIMELALGFGGGENALLQFGADSLGLTLEEMIQIKIAWRKASPNIKAFWYDLQRAAIRAVRNPGRRYYATDTVAYEMVENWLSCILPSGRRLYYYTPEIDRDGTLSYMTVKEKSGQFLRTTTWGGKLCENVVQAVACDLLTESLIKVHDYKEFSFSIPFHVHDEIITETKEEYADKGLSILCDIMADAPKWADGLPLRADGYVTSFYMKEEDYLYGQRTKNTDCSSTKCSA